MANNFALSKPIDKQFISVVLLSLMVVWKSTRKGNSQDLNYLEYHELQESMSYTLPWNATSNNESTIHMEAHNMYGSFQIRSLKKYYNTSNSDIFIMSATKGNEEPQPSLIKNIDTSWTNLETYIDNILFNSIVGNHLVSFPVCGDTNIYNSSLQESLCIRWYLVAATMPMFRIGSYKPWRDPTNLNTVFAQKAAERAIERRKLLLPYYYTLLSKHEPVIRPMFYDYYENITTFSLKHQYMIGENILIAHPFSAGKRKLQVYLPSRVGIWYELWGGELYNSTDNPWINIDIVETDFVAFISQGTVLPLMVGNNLDCRAQGTLLQESYWNFSANQTSISISNIPKENCNYTLENITLYYTTDNYYSKYYILEKDLCIGESDITLEYSVVE
ncbi:hypothetical protein NQ317_005830 [Molorchus minor]|uniref:Uncharacterized protein n=1 Tax=Molorchus minor TaxID=1323400 RepID=A0ABQ9JZ87_9CUCU|nr:hypothetical protein NQ317_005830 [Molorchus minor]